MSAGRFVERNHPRRVTTASNAHHRVHGHDDGLGLRIDGHHFLRDITRAVSIVGV